jgi:RNA-directed DNA polymerase
MSEQLELALEVTGESSKLPRSEQTSTAVADEDGSGTGSLMEVALSRPNMKRALKRVRRNKGSPGVDGMTVYELSKWLVEHWPRTREHLLVGTYQPRPVRRVTIPKPDGGQRHLGIPCVLDRLIQQALLQVLHLIFDPTFSKHSHGFRPRRSAHGAIREARQYVEDGKRWVVDVDLEKFFDRVNHDVLMGKLANRIEDRRVLKLIRRYLEADVMADAVVTKRVEGTPQGGPLSPLLANVLLDEVDKRLEQRGHAFVRYADDLRVFVGSKRAGQRVMNSLVAQFERLHLQINRSKSAVDRADKRPFLGISFWMFKGEARLKVSPKALKKFKRRVRHLTRRSRGRSMAQVIKSLQVYLIGWRGYFAIANESGVMRDLDGWIRRRLRAYQLKQWKRGTTVFRELVARRLDHWEAIRIARSASSWWKNSRGNIHKALPNSLFERLGLPRLAT